MSDNPQLPGNWRLRDRLLDVEKTPLIMGVLNVTPDSFSDGGDWLEPSRAVDRAHEMVAEGAGIIDVGGESTRPKAPVVALDEERRRVGPVLERLLDELEIPISIDTRKPELAAFAVSLGVHCINDVGAACALPEMLDTVAESGVGYVCMHMQGDPQTMQSAPRYDDVVQEVDGFFSGLLRIYQQAGIESEQVVLDIGVGFGKSVNHNLELIRHLGIYRKHGRPLLLGVSRKSFIGKLLGLESPTDRVSGSLACACWGLRAGASIFRVHDVAATTEALKLWQAIEHAS